MFTLDFSKLSKDSVDLAGGKGASLGEMARVGIPVPPGFVVLANAFEEFLSSNNLDNKIADILQGLNWQEPRSLEESSEKIKKLIFSASLPRLLENEINQQFSFLDAEVVAVRSSATAEDSSADAWAGQLDSFLNTTAENLILNIKNCWASLFNPRAIFYRFEKGLDDKKISVAVVVQKMIQSEVSGIAFSVHPVTENRDQIIIEAGFGLGEAIVSGQVTPDSYVVDKNNFNIIDCQVNVQKRGIYRRAEGQGSDWQEINLEKGKQQCLPDSQIKELALLIVRIERHYGFPCDIEWALAGGNFYIVQSRPITTLKMVAGNQGAAASDFKNNLLNFQKVIQDRQYITQQGDISIALLGSICNAIQSRYISLYNYSHIQPILTLQKGSHGICYFDLEMYRDFSRVSYSRIKDSIFNLPEYKDYKKMSKEIDDEYNNFSISENLAELKKQTLYYFELAKKYLVSTLYCEAVDHQIVRELAEMAAVQDIDKFVETSILSTRPSFVNHQNQLLLGGQDFSWAFANYFAAPTKQERFALLNKKRLEANRAELENEIKKTNKLVADNNRLLNDLINHSSAEQRRVIEFVQTAIHIRDERKEFILKLFTMLSDSLRSLAETLGISYEEISTVTENEIEKLWDASFRKTLQKRFDFGVAMISSNNEPVISSVDYDDVVKIIFSQSSEGDTVKGICANKGKYIGIVRVLVSEKDFHNFCDGEVLVTGMTRAEYVPLMRKAGAIVTDEGGVTCHAAIVSRELNKPCIIGTRNSTQILKNGDKVEVDADNGLIKVIKSDSKPSRWLKVFSRAHNLQRMSFLWPYFTTGLMQDRSIKLNELLVVPNEGRHDYYFQEDEWNLCLEKLSQQLLSQTISAQEEYFVSLATNFLAVSREVYESDLKSWSAQDLAGWYRRFLDIYSFYSLYVLTPFALESKIYPQLSYWLTDNYPDRANEYLDIISTPIKNNNLLEQQINLLQIASHGCREEDILQHAAKYFWIPVYNLGGQIWTKDDFIKQLADFKNPAEELKIRLADVKQRKQNFFRFLEEVKEDKTLDHLARLVNFYVSLRDDSRDVWRQSLCYIYPFYKEIERRAGLEPDSSVNLLNEEIFSFLSDGKIPLDLAARNLMHAVSFDANGIRIITEPAEIKNLKDGLSDFGDGLEFRGFSAYKGVVSGRVRIINSREDLTSLQIGEILVSHHTSPDYLLAMKKAAAFVTDEGGVTSHAAIVARELKIPCVIATGNASTSLQTGDEIEVDADKGVVRVINKK